MPYIPPHILQARQVPKETSPKSPPQTTAQTQRSPTLPPSSPVAKGTSTGRTKLGDVPIQVKSLKGKTKKCSKSADQNTGEAFPALTKKGEKQNKATVSGWSNTVQKMVEQDEKLRKEEQLKKENQEKERLQKVAEEEKYKQELQKHSVLCPHISQRISFIEETTFIPYGEELCDPREYETTDEPYVEGWDVDDEEEEEEDN